MLNAAIDLNHFYGLMVVNQVVRSIRGGCAIRYIRIETGTSFAWKEVMNMIYNDLSNKLNNWSGVLLSVSFTLFTCF